MRVAEVFAGVLGIGLGLEAVGCETVWAAEIDPFAQRVIRARRPGVEVVGDVRDVDGGAPKVPMRKDRLTCAGNAVVPAVVSWVAARGLAGHERRAAA